MELFLRESELAACRRLYQEIHAGTLSMEDGFRRVLEIDPYDHVAWLAMGVTHREQGRPEEALNCFWRALEARPSQAECYSVVYESLLQAGSEPELTQGIAYLALNRTLRDPEAPKQIRKNLLKQIRRDFRLRGLDAESLTYLTGVLARLSGNEPIHVTKLLKPYRVIQPVIDLSDTGMPREAVDEILQLGAPCVNLLMGLVRAWIRSTPQSHAPPTTLGAVAALALLGETGDATLLPDLIECVDIDEDEVAFAAAWAARRIAKRFPGADAGLELPPEAEDLTVYDFCLCAGGDDYAFDDYASHDQPAAPRPVCRPGRNDPCWCGSGKKYKKCHLDSDEREDGEWHAPEDTGPPPLLTLDRRMTETLLRFTVDHVSAKEVKRASDIFLGDTLPEGGPEDVEAVFFDWLLHDYCPRGFGRPIPQEYLSRHRQRLSPEQRRELEERINSRHSLFEVQRVEPGTGIELRDLLLDDTLFVHDVRSSNSFVAWDCLLARVRDCGERKVFTGNGLLVPRRLCPTLRDWIIEDRQASGLEWPVYLRANSHRLRQECLRMYEDWREGLQIRNTDDEPFVISRARFKVLDGETLEKALESCPELHPEDRPEGSRRFTWLKPSPDHTVLATFRLEGDSLSVECNSRPRLERAVELLTRLAGAAVSETDRDYRTIEEARRNYVPSEEKDSEPPIPPEVAADLIGRHLEQHYSTWPDRALPALDGLTPRQAAARPEMRQRLINLLKELENAELHNKRDGRPYYDMSRIKSTLGVEY